MTPIFDGQILNDGKISLDKKRDFDIYTQSLAGKRIQLTVEKMKRTRSHSQNAYYWGVVVRLIAQHTGHDPEQIHELLKHMFSPKWAFGSNRIVRIPTSTTRLDTLEFVDYTEKCRLWANDFLGLNIPLPGEVAL